MFKFNHYGNMHILNYFYCMDLYERIEGILEAVATEHSRQKISITCSYVALLMALGFPLCEQDVSIIM